MDEVERCLKETTSSIFPNDVENRGVVIFLNIIHILGVIIILLGILLPPHLLKYYIVYSIFIYFSYVLLDNRCFMTVLANYIGKKNYNALCIKMNKARKFLVLYIMIAILFFLYPQYSIFNVLIK